MAEARRRLGGRAAAQGNLDPGLLLGPWETLAARATRILEAGTAPGPGYIFNLGHGVLPQTDVAALQRLTELVHGFRPS
jgi:uroporphyrinogen decarboxylase